MDWAQKTISDLRSRNLIGDDCTRAFTQAYEHGDTLAAYEAFLAASKINHVFNPGCYMLHIFADGSCWYDAQEGIDAFWPDVSDLAAASDDVREVI